MDETTVTPQQDTEMKASLVSSSYFSTEQLEVT